MVLLKSQKPQVVEEIKALIAGSKTVGVLDMAKTPAGQALKIKGALSDIARFKMARKGLLKRALEGSGKSNLEKLSEAMDTAGSPALIVSNENPFALYQKIKKARAKAPAKVGGVAPKDIVVPKGKTDIAPGPAMTTLGKVGLKTRVEAGKISIANDKVVVKAGDAVNADVAAVLNMLKIEPMEIGLNVVAAYEDGMVYAREILDVDPEQYVQNLMGAVQAAVNFSLNINYPTKLTAPLMIQKAFMEMKALGREARILEKETVGELLAKAEADAKALEALVPKTENEAKK